MTRPRSYKGRYFYEYGYSNMRFHRMGHRRTDLVFYSPGKRTRTPLYDLQGFLRHPAKAPLISNGRKPPRGSQERMRARMTTKLRMKGRDL